MRAINWNHSISHLMETALQRNERKKTKACFKITWRQGKLFISSSVTKSHLLKKKIQKRSVVKNTKEKWADRFIHNKNITQITWFMIKPKNVVPFIIFISTQVPQPFFHFSETSKFNTVSIMLKQRNLELCSEASEDNLICSSNLLSSIVKFSTPACKDSTNQLLKSFCSGYLADYDRANWQLTK